MSIRFSRPECPSKTFSNFFAFMYASRLDQLLHGGFALGEVTELVGPSASGKSQVNIIYHNNLIASLTDLFIHSVTCTPIRLNSRVYWRTKSWIFIITSSTTLLVSKTTETSTPFPTIITITLSVAFQIVTFSIPLLPCSRLGRMHARSLLITLRTSSFRFISAHLIVSTSNHNPHSPPTPITPPQPPIRVLTHPRIQTLPRITCVRYIFSYHRTFLHFPSSQKNDAWVGCEPCRFG